MFSCRSNNYYSITRLRSLSLSRAGTPHPDLWQAFVLVCGILGSDNGSPELALPALGSFLWTEKDSTPDLKGCLVSNRKFLDAVHAVAFVQDRNVRRAVDYRNLGAEELGSVYESLLELHPLVNADAGIFELRTAAGHERKTTGSYYTPDSLVQCLLDSALEPVMADAIRGKKDQEAVEAILNLKVCDPAVGSGHFLIAAAHRMAKKVAALSTGEEEPAPAAVRVALRDVIGHCLYGVDVNPMAAELCRVSLWMEALVPGKPLAFLDHHIQVGNSLLGATPELIAKGIPDEAFTAIEGDDKKACTILKKRNKEQKKTIAIEHAGQAEMIHEQLRKSSVTLEAIPDESLTDIRNKEIAYREMKSSDEHKLMKLLADTWCAAFVTRKVFQEPDDPRSTTGVTQRHLDEVAAGGSLPEDVFREVNELVKQYGFFHWHLAFPEVFSQGGFDCILGNPPWERVKIQEKEWFAERRPEIANAHKAADRKRLIENLKINDSELYKQFLDDLRKAEGESYFLRNSGRYPLCGRGDINTYSVFAEGMFNLNGSSGRLGCVLPTGIATDDTTKLFFQHIVEKKILISLFDFENEGFFPAAGQGHMNRFCLITLAAEGNSTSSADFMFRAQHIEDLCDPERHFNLSTADIELLNPNTHTCPIFKSCLDAELNKAIYRRVPVLIREAQADHLQQNPWGINFSTMFHMANDSQLFRTKEQLESDGWCLKGNIFYKDDAQYLPLYEPKLFHQFNHRYNTFEGVDHTHLHTAKALTQGFTIDNLKHSDHVPLPRYWVSEMAVKKSWHYNQQWIIAIRGVTNTANRRTSVSCVLPIAGIGHNATLIQTSLNLKRFAYYLLGTLNSFIFDYVLRNKIGSYMSQFIINQLPVPTYHCFEQSLFVTMNPTTPMNWILSHVLELTYTSWDLEPFAQDCGFYNPPFQWNEERRFLLTCELDAAFFHIYLPATPDGNWKHALIDEGSVCDETPEELTELMRHVPTPRHALAYIMDTFPTVRHKDLDKYNGYYRTKRVILEIYDEMTDAIRTNKPYQTRLDPPPADLRCCHPPRDNQS